MGSLFKKEPPEPLFAGDSANRYNLPGTKTLYFGEDFVTAYAETVQKEAHLLIEHPTRELLSSTGDVEIERPEPVALFAVVARVENVLDLTEAWVRQKLGVPEKVLLSPWRWEYFTLARPVLTQVLGNAAYESERFEAIRYPAAKAHDRQKAHDAACWVVFVDRLAGGSFLEVADVSGRLRGRLPRA